MAFTRKDLLGIRELSVEEINTILVNPEVKSRIEGIGWDVVGGTPQQFADFMAAERARWQPVITRSGARID